jgi:hypothetical protein
MEAMNPLPAPNVPGETDWQRFDNAVRKVFSVSPEAIQKETARMKREREKKKRAKKPMA